MTRLYCYRSLPSPNINKVPENVYLGQYRIFEKNYSQYNLTAQIEQMQDQKNYSIMSRHYRNQMRGTAQLQPQCEVSFRWVRT